MHAPNTPTAHGRTRLATLFLALALFAGSAAAAPAEGEPAPEFRLQDQNGDWHALADYAGKWVAVYFYPKDDTPGCTRQACALRDDIFKFRKMDVAIVGVSLDDVSSHREFAEKYSLPFTLLSDSEKEMADAYGVLRTFGVFKLASRQTFLIAPDGRIAKHYEKVDPDTHSETVLSDLAALVATNEPRVKL